MLSIKDYLNLKTIYYYLEQEYNKLKQENNGFTNEPLMRLESMIEDLDKIFKKLEEN